MKRSWKIGLLLLAAAFLPVVFSLLSGCAETATAANPTTMSFQGKVVNADGTNVTDGTYTFLFKLYTVSSAGSAIWTETQSSVTVTAGVFQVNLGSSCLFFTANACNNNTIIDFNANPNMYLGITFNNDAAGEMTPRVQLQSVPFAYNADKVGGLSVSQLVQLSPGVQQAGFISVNGTGTFGGTLNATSNTTGLVLSGAPAAAATSSLLQLGSAIVGGNATAGTGGTYLGLNTPASGAGSTADFINFQLNGVSKLTVTSAGILTAPQIVGSTGIYTGPTGSVAQRINASGDVSARNLTTTGFLGSAAILSATITPSATISLVQLGATNIASGNATAGTGGTYLGLNAPASGAGSTADFINFQNGGTSKFKVDSTGTITTTTGSLSNVTTTSSTSVVTPALSSSGALSITSGSTNNVNIDTGATGGAINIGTGNAASVSISRAGQTTTVNGALTVAQGAGFTGSVTMNFTGTQGLSLTSDLAGSSNGFKFVGTPSATAGTTNGVFVQQGAGAGANGLDNGITIDNANASTAIGAAINISNTGGGGFTKILSSTNANLDASGNFTLGGTLQGATLTATSAVNGATLGISGAGTIGGTLGVSGTLTTAGGATLSAFSGGSWLDLPTTGPSGIGTGGAGSNAFLGYAQGAGNWFTNAAAGDVAYRNTGGRLLFGNSGGNSQLVMSSASTIFQNTSLLPLFTVDNTNTRLQVGSATTDANAVLLVVDSYNNATDPAGTDGAIYYNSSLARFRCYEDATWRDCLGSISVVKKADQSVTNSTTFTDATDLAFPVEANGYYTFTADIPFNASSATADLKYTIIATTATNLIAHGTAPTTTGTTAAPNDCDMVASNTTCNVLTTGAGNGILRIVGYVQNGASAGTVKMQFAQRLILAGQSVTFYKGGTIEYHLVQ